MPMPKFCCASPCLQPRIPLDCPCSLLREWIALAVSEWPAPQAGEVPQPLAGFESIHRVEGTALVLLCSTDVEVSLYGRKHEYCFIFCYFFTLFFASKAWRTF